MVWHAYMSIRQEFFLNFMCKIGADLQSHIKLNTSNMGILPKIEDFEGVSSYIQGHFIFE
jgi:hypothetical protein